ncbi:hypothetical protein [Anaerobiospirillum succiniciproducens]|nr:hypothetical protein [Anaerobiospirillum succiniciproducens]
MIKMISGIVITLSFLVCASVVIANQHLLKTNPDVTEDHHISN